MHWLDAAALSRRRHMTSSLSACDDVVVDVAAD